MQAISGHRSLAEIERYTQQADQRRLARAAIGTLPDKDWNIECLTKARLDNPLPKALTLSAA